MLHRPRSTRLQPRTALVVCVCAGTLISPGCSRPFSPLEADYGKRVALERLRVIDRLDRDRYAAPSANAAEPPPAEPSPRGKPASRLDGRESIPLTIEDLRGATLQNNADVRVSLIEPTIRSQSLRAEEAKFEAVFRPFIQRVDSDSPTLDVTAANVQKTTSFGGGVDIPLRSGGRVSFDLTANRQQTIGNSFFIPSAYSTAATFSFSQPLLEGAGRRFNTASIRIAALNQQISEAQAKLEVIRQLAAADKGYWRLYAARRELEVRQKQYELAQVQLERAQRRVAAGDLTPIEVTRAESGLAQRLEGIITAENTVLQTQREIKRLMNRADLPVDSRNNLLTATEPGLVRYAFDAGALTDAAVANRMEMLELELQFAQDFTNIETAKNRLLPTFTLDFQYSFPGVGTSLSSSADQVRAADFHRWQAGISGRIPLGNEAARAGYAEAVLRRLQRLSTREARELSIRKETLDAIDSAEAAWQRIMAARQSVLAAARTFEAEQRQFDAGSRTSTDVLDAASRLADAQSTEIRAISDYQIAQVDLAFATGTMLGAGSIDLSPIDPRTPDADPTPPTLPFYADPDTRAAPINSGTHDMR